MAGGKDIRDKIRSIRNTQKITRAMEMVAASKMRKTQDLMRHARPYAEKIRNVINHVGHANSEYKHAFMAERDKRRVGYIIVSTDRGLCGGLNTNMFRKCLKIFQDWQFQGMEVDSGQARDRGGAGPAVAPLDPGERGL